MSEKQDAGSSQDTGGMDWAGAMTEFWNPLMKAWGQAFAAEAPEPEAEVKGRMNESLAGMAKMFQTLFGAMSEPAAMENFQRTAQMAPDIVLGFCQTSMQSFIKFQGRVNDWVIKRGSDTADFDAQAFDQEFINLWTSLYEEELSQYLKIPQVGLGRVYQERVMRATDELNRFQAVLSGFMQLLYLPMEKSFKTMQDKTAEMAQAGPLDDQSKTYYNLWIKVLEGHYMEMFKTDEFSDALGETLTALNHFVLARREVVNDVLKAYAIPTHHDLNDLYKEIYLLKKRMRAFEKHMSA